MYTYCMHPIYGMYKSSMYISYVHFEHSPVGKNNNIAKFFLKKVKKDFSFPFVGMAPLSLGKHTPPFPIQRFPKNKHAT